MHYQLTLDSSKEYRYVGGHRCFKITQKNNKYVNLSIERPHNTGYRRELWNQTFHRELQGEFDSFIYYLITTKQMQCI